MILERKAGSVHDDSSPLKAVANHSQDLVIDDCNYQTDQPLLIVNAIHHSG